MSQVASNLQCRVFQRNGLLVMEFAVTNAIRDHQHIQPPPMDWLVLLYWEGVIAAPRPTKKLVFVPMYRHTDCITMASGWRVLVSRAKWVVRQEEPGTDSGGEESCQVAGSRCTTQAV